MENSNALSEHPCDMCGIDIGGELSKEFCSEACAQRYSKRSAKARRKKPKTSNVVYAAQLIAMYQQQAREILARDQGVYGYINRANAAAGIPARTQTIQFMPTPRLRVPEE